MTGIKVTGVAFDGGYADYVIAPWTALAVLPDSLPDVEAAPAAELTKLGGAKAVIATVTNGPAMAATLGGLAPRGRLLVLGAAHESIEASLLTLIMGHRAIEGWYSGTSIDSEDTLAFSTQTGVRSMNESYPLERAQEALDRMKSGQARFRVVLTTGN